jgi:hypothetical protein
MSKKHRPDSTKIPTEEPTVIVEMSFSEKYLPLIYSKHVQIGIFVVAFLGLTAVGSVWYLDYRQDAQAEARQPTQTAASPQEIVVTIVAEPSNATILIDGKTMEQNPVILNLTADSEHHTIIAKAPGHQTLERDVRFNKTRTIRLELPELVEPEGGASNPMPNPDPSSAVQEVITD